MAANSALQVTGLSFPAIRQNLRNYIASNPTFADLDFNDSAIGTLLDLLAYNTYLVAFYTNMATNEAFLDTAQLYDSVVSRAKALGYRPISSQGATAKVQVAFALTANSTVRALTVRKGTQFTASVNGASYIFSTPQATTIAANSSNKFSGTLDIIEGLPLTHTWTYNTSNTTFTIPNANADLRTVSITTTSGANTTNWQEASDILGVSANSLVYFIDAAQGNLYTVRFGDNILGKQPAQGSQVAVSYSVCNASKPNGANTFTAVSDIAGLTNFTLTTVQRALGGTLQEPIESVRFNAPRMYQTQHRAVLATDYERLLLEGNPDLAAVSAWGGEDNFPPIYGKVYISVKPQDSTATSASKKSELKSFIQRYSVQGITVEFVDPTYLYIVPNVTVSYDPVNNPSNATDVAAAVGTVISNYEATVLNRFNGTFRGSKFLQAVDNAHPAIVGSTLTLQLEKRFVPSLTQTSSYTFTFNHGFYWPNPGNLYAISSTAFTYKNTANCFFDDDGFGNVRIYTPQANGTRTYLDSQAGTVDYTNGIVVLLAFLPQAFVGEEISIFGKSDPSKYTVAPVRNQILLLRDATVSVVNDQTDIEEVDNMPISTLGSSTTLLAPSFSTTVAF